MPNRITVGDLGVADVLYHFVTDEALPGTGVEPETFWSGAEKLFADFGPRNAELIARRLDLQHVLDHYYRENKPGEVSADDYERFLRSIGYLVDEPERFEIATTGVDIEVSEQPGPQLVVPLLNERFALNAANARWGSLYDALYGTDVIDGRTPDAADTYDPVRGEAVIARARAFLDGCVPLESRSHGDAVGYQVVNGDLQVSVGDATPVFLADPSRFVGYRGCSASPEAILMVHNGLHIELLVDRSHPIGATNPAGVKDVVLESAVTTIMDLEDSVAAVDVEDKAHGYRNWLRLMQGTLAAEVTKSSRTFTRVLNPDRCYTAADGSTLVLPGRALMFIRQVGLLMTTDAVLGPDGEEVPEGLLDALVCGLASLHDIRRTGARGNSRAGVSYAVKPKLHGPDEVEFTCKVFDRVEQILGLPRFTTKIGIMDEERRTSANLRACVHAARDRIAFINTGFLDRTGDEIHTSMYAGAMVRKGEMRDTAWMRAYEDGNVDVGLSTGFAGRAQIGKGMWAATDNLADMVRQKIDHPRAGATCAWVPSPTAATLHAMHYHDVDVVERQRELRGRLVDRRRDLLTVPLADLSSLTATEIQAELDNNVQGVLGYVVRWINAGIGCSKVPDLAGTPLMEDRATCRISSQHVANWLEHGVITLDQVEQSLRRMAAIVDEQNVADDDYRPMSPAYDGPAFLAARSLIIDGRAQPSGYTEPILHAYRRALKEGRRP